MKKLFKGMQERKLRLRIEVGCRLGINHDLLSKLGILIIRMFVPSGVVPSKSRLFTSLTCECYIIWMLLVQWMWWVLISTFPLITLCPHTTFIKNRGKGINLVLGHLWVSAIFSLYSSSISLFSVLFLFRQLRKWLLFVLITFERFNTA